MLLPPDLREWVAKDDLAHFILEALEGVDGGQAVVNERGSGSPQYPPTMVLAVLLYCYAHGIFASRKIEAATSWHVSVRYLAGNHHPDHDTIATFRRVNEKLVRASFLRVLELAKEIGLLRLGTVAIDGTKLLANAAKRRTLNQSQLEAEQAELALTVNQLLEQAAQAEAQDQTEAGDRLPGELASKVRRQAVLARAKELLDERAEQRAQAVREESARAKAQGCEGPREERVRAPVAPVVNVSDPESRLQPTRHSGFIQGYNAQAAVCVESGLIVAARVVNDTNDRRQLAPMAAAIPKHLGPVAAIVVDTGYDNTAHILEVERMSGARVYCALQKDQESARPSRQLRSAPRRRTRAVRLGMKRRLRSTEGKRVYAARQSSVEPVFGMIKSVLGFRGFGLRGLAKVNLEWELVSAAFNCRRLAARRAQKT